MSLKTIQFGLVVSTKEKKMEQYAPIVGGILVGAFFGFLITRIVEKRKNRKTGGTGTGGGGSGSGRNTHIK